MVTLFIVGLTLIGGAAGIAAVIGVALELLDVI